MKREIFDVSPNYIDEEVNKMSDCRHNAPNREPQAGDVQTQWQQLDEQTREELVDKLVDCLYSAEGEPDIEAIDRCLADLDAAGAAGPDFDVEQSLKDFHARFDAAFESRPAPVKRPPRRLRPLARIAIIAAILCAFMFTAQASGFDLFGAIARWTSEQFSFVKTDEGEREDDQQLPYASLQAALDDCNITEKLSPTEFPIGTELSEIRVRETESGVLISARYTQNSKPFFISLKKVADVPYSEVEINDPNIEIYMVGEIEHHLMADVTQRKAMWNNGAWECYIAGDLTREDLVMMIDSIYK